MGMDDLLKRAIALEVEEIVRKRENAYKQQEDKAKEAMADQASKVKFPSGVQSSIGKFFN